MIDCLRENKNKKTKSSKSQKRPNQNIMFTCEQKSIESVCVTKITLQTHLIL